jgi:hypothetical protein
MSLQTNRWALRLSVVTCLLVGFGPGTARGEAPGAENLLGHRGMLRTVAASNQPAGYIGLGTDFQYFTAGDFLTQGEDHARMINTYSIVWAPVRFLEAAFALHVTSDKSALGGKEELMVAVGDPEISLKGGFELGHGLAVGGLFDLRFPSGSGFFEPSLSSTSFLFGALGSWTLSKSIPLSVHLNLGFYYDGTSNLFDKPSDLTQAQLYAAQVSSFHRVVTRFGAEYNTKYVGPFFELSLEPFVGDGAPGFGDSPGIISFGARGWPTQSKSVQLLAAMDIAVTGVASGEPAVPTTSDKHAFVLPRWNFVLRLSYRFDAYAKPGTGTVEPPPPPPPEPPKAGVIVGTVLDAATSKPVWNAQVSVSGEETSKLAVDPGDGSFRTFKLPVGRHTVMVAAEGYTATQAEATVTADGTTTLAIRLQAKTTEVPGTLRGSIRALVGKNPKQATLLIPELDRTVSVGADGEFSVQLKAGEYRVVVSAPGFRTQTKQIRVGEGATVILNVELHK